LYIINAKVFFCFLFVLTIIWDTSWIQLARFISFLIKIYIYLSNFVHDKHIYFNLNNFLLQNKIQLRNILELAKKLVVNFTNHKCTQPGCEPLFIVDCSQKQKQFKWVNFNHHGKKSFLVKLLLNYIYVIICSIRWYWKMKLKTRRNKRVRFESTCGLSLGVFL